MPDDDYDDEQALMGYVFRNYPQIVESWNCYPSPERVRDELPPGMRDAYMEHVAECQRIFDELDAEGPPFAQGVLRDLPPLPPELREAKTKATERLERQIFWEKFRPYQDQVFIHRCMRCQQILINDKTRQCLSCGYDWHGVEE